MTAKTFARIGVAAAMMLFATASSTFAQPAPAAPAAQPSANAIALARELITLQGGATLYESVVPGVIEQVKNLFMQTNPMLQKDLNDTAAKLRTDLQPRSAELMNQVATLYASRFTEQELKDVVAFYKTPLGKKMTEEEPKVIDQSMSLAQNWGNKLSEEVIALMRVEMKKKGKDL
jgi:hypothetical protein